MTSPIMSRLMWAFRAGLQFSGRRNLYEVFGYPRILTAPLLYGKYQRQDIVSRIVEMPPEETWSQMPTLKQDSPLKTKWDQFVKVTQLRKYLVQADKMCNFGAFSVVVLGLPGKLDQPFTTLSKLEDISYVSVYGGDSVRISQYFSNKDDPNFGQPKMYEIQTGNTPANSLSGGNFPAAPTIMTPIHATRVIHIVDRPVQGNHIGEPRLAKVYNILEDLIKVSGGSAELYWILGNRGMQVDVDKEMELEPADEAALTQELDEYQHNLRRYIRTRGVKINPLGSEVADPRGPFSVAMSLLAATTGIPQRILMGAEAGQLASEQDRANWAESIERRRVSFGVPYVLQPFMRWLGQVTYLDKLAWTEADETAWEWPDAFHMNPVEESNALASVGRTIVNMSRRNQFGNPIISDEECRKMLKLPEKPKAGDTFPEAPPPATGPQTLPDGSKDSKVPVAEQPSAVKGNESPNTSTNTDSEERPQL